MVLRIGWATDELRVECWELYVRRELDGRQGHKGRNQGTI